MLSTGASTMPTLKEIRDDRPAGKRRSRLPASTGAGQMSERAEDMRSLGSRSRYADSLVISRVVHSARGFPVRLFPSKQTDNS
jgi:hypothetical protein